MYKIPSPPHFPTSKRGNKLWSAGEAPGGGWSHAAEKGGTAGAGVGLGLTLEHPLSMHMKSAPFWNRTEGSPCRCPGHQWPKPGAHSGFLSEGPIRPSLRLLLVPTSWDTARNPHIVQPFSWLAHLHSSASPASPGRIMGNYIPWYPGFLISPTQVSLSCFSEGLPAIIQQGLHRPPPVGLALPEAPCSSSSL